MSDFQAAIQFAFLLFQFVTSCLLQFCFSPGHRLHLCFRLLADFVSKVLVDLCSVTLADEMVVLWKDAARKRLLVSAADFVRLNDGINLI